MSYHFPKKFKDKTHTHFIGEQRTASFFFILILFWVQVSQPWVQVSQWACQGFAVTFYSATRVLSWKAVWDWGLGHLFPECYLGMSAEGTSSRNFIQGKMESCVKSHTFFLLLAVWCLYTAVLAGCLGDSVLELICMCWGVGFEVVTKLSLTNDTPIVLLSFVPFLVSLSLFFPEAGATEKVSGRTLELVLSDREITSSTLNFSAFRQIDQVQFLKGCGPGSSLTIQIGPCWGQWCDRHPTHYVTFVEIKAPCPLCLRMVFMYLTLP